MLNRRPVSASIESVNSRDGGSFVAEAPDENEIEICKSSCGQQAN